MKIASFIAKNRTTFGVVVGDRVYDLALHLGDTYGSLRDYLNAHGADLTRLEELIRGAEADYFVDDVQFLPVITNPDKIVCVGLNYHAHRTEGNHATTANPALFLRVNDSQTGHEQPLLCPAESDSFDYEGEIALIIGKGGRRIPESEALSHIAGISCYNDGSVRDWQAETAQWTAGKNFPDTGSLGPWMVTCDELSPASRLEVTTRLNGKVMQQSNTDLLIFPFAKLISFISTIMPLYPGDVLVTGTPGGVGFRLDPQVFMKDGDVIEIEVSDVGVLRNTVKKEKTK